MRCGSGCPGSPGSPGAARTPGSPGAAGHRAAEAPAVALTATPTVAPAVAAGRWERFARVVMRRPGAFVLASGVLLVTLALPFLHVRFGGIDERALPAGADGRVVAEALQRDFTAPSASPILVLVEGADAAATRAFATRIGDVPGVSGVRPVAQQGGTTLFDVDYPGEALDAAARRDGRPICGLCRPGRARVLSAGSPRTTSTCATAWPSGCRGWR